MSALVERLLSKSHPVEVSLRPDRTLSAFQECLDRGYVHIRFTDTEPGTELGLAMDPRRTVTRTADFDSRTGAVILVGRLTLDYVNVECIVEINLFNLTGQGRLEKLPDN